ncbi:MAG: histidine kinase [Lachnospiraceae bacterium]|nr:histidine kinase [Lachnospiraceae bacterium]
MTQMVDNIVNNTVIHTEDAIEDINNTTFLFQTDTGNSGTLIDNIKKYSDPSQESTYYDLYISRQNIKYICQTFLFTNQNINGIFVLLPNHQSFGWGNGIDISYDYVPDEDEWYLDTLALHGKMYISDVSQKPFILRSTESVFFAKALYDVYSGRFLGVVLIDCNPAIFDLSSINTLPNALYINIHAENDTSQIYYNNIDNIEKSFFKYNSDNILSRSIVLDNWPVRVDAKINLSSYTSHLQNVRMLMFGIALLILLLLTVIYYPLSAYVIRPITLLTRHIHTTHLEKPAYSDKYTKRKDEIGLLYTEYNQMIDSLNEYIRKDYQNKLITLDAQMRALEAQIDAHFLFNTLETINSIAEIEEVESIATISMALGNMFRYSIKTQSELVSLDDEIHHVMDYVSIQTIRFDNRFSIQYNIPDEYRSYRVLKLILQPVVENCINHGFKHCMISGIITISADVEGDILRIRIRDNGIGMDERQLRSLNDLLQSESKLNELGHREHQSIGLKNIHSRIQLYYGAVYGLSVESKEQEGTTITICIPIIKEET